jgi:hypothetical protein
VRRDPLDISRSSHALNGPLAKGYISTEPLPTAEGSLEHIKKELHGDLLHLTLDETVILAFLQRKVSDKLQRQD